MTPEKPITDNMRQKCNDFYKYMKSKSDYVTKAELMQVFGIANERTVRDVIATLASRVPIISTSDCKGYKLAQSESDLELVEHSWAELSKRMEELEKRIKPLAKFRDKVKFNLGEVL